MVLRLSSRYHGPTCFSQRPRQQHGSSSHPAHPRGSAPFFGQLRPLLFKKKECQSLSLQASRIPFRSCDTDAAGSRWAAAIRGHRCTKVNLPALTLLLKD